MVTLHGTILRELNGRFCFRVAAHLADAPQFGLAGEIWLARHQCFEVIEASKLNQLDVVQIPESVARSKVTATLPIPQRGRR